MTRYPSGVELAQWDAQTLFNHVACHLLAQARAATDGCACRYRHAGLACAIGCFIPESEYRASFEGQTVLTLARATCHLGAFADLLHRQLGLCVALQRIHDGAAVPRWPGLLRALAEAACLSPTVLPPCERDTGFTDVLYRGKGVTEVLLAYFENRQFAAMRARALASRQEAGQGAVHHQAARVIEGEAMAL